VAIGSVPLYSGARYGTTSGVGDSSAAAAGATAANRRAIGRKSLRSVRTIHLYFFCVGILPIGIVTRERR
jgi:hypothetical protein